MPWLHLPEPLGAGRCTLACTARRPGHLPHRASVRGACMPWLRTHRPGARGAERWRRSGEGAPRHALAPRALARGRGPACRDGGEHRPPRPCTARHRPIPPFCVTTATASLWRRYRRTAPPPACLIPSRFSQAVGIATKSPLCIHTSAHFSAPFRRRRPGPPASPLRPHPFKVIGARRAPHAAVRRRRGADRYSPADPLGSRSGPGDPLRTSLGVHSGSQGSFRFLRVLPGSSPAVPTGM